MSVDSRIVNLTFDNKQFEAGVKESIETLENLKKALELDKAVESLSNLEKAAGNFNLDGLNTAIDNVNSHFKILGRTAENIVGKIANSLTKVVESTAKAVTYPFSKEAIMGGKEKYEAETLAVATMKYALPNASTEEIYATLDKLREYSDETSYSFSQMVDNMSKFIAAGVEDLGAAEMSMEGIANWAAKAGVTASSPQFSRVLYNLSQAMGMGSMQVRDWMSIEQAHMATKEVKEQLIGTAAAMGLLTEKSGKYFTVAKKGHKSMEVSVENMRESLQAGWLTNDVLIKTMEKYADRTTEFGNEGFYAAQKARTLADAIEAVKDAVTSGWAETFKLVFGDMDHATELFTGMAEALIDFTDGITSARNAIVEVWAGPTAAADGIKGTIEDVMGMTDALKSTFGNDVLNKTLGNMFNGNVDLKSGALKRRKIIGKSLSEDVRKAWGIAKDDTATVMSETFTNKDFGIERETDFVINVTPITPNGKILKSPEQLEEYVEWLMGQEDIKKADKKGTKLSDGTYVKNLLLDYRELAEGETLDQAKDKAVAAAKALHDIHQQMLENGNTKFKFNAEEFFSYMNDLADSGLGEEFIKQHEGMLEAIQEYYRVKNLKKGDKDYKNRTKLEQQAVDKLAASLYNGQDAWEEYFDNLQKTRDAEKDAEKNTGRGMLISGISSLWQSLQSVSNLIGTAAEVVFGTADKIGQALVGITAGFKNFADGVLGFFTDFKNRTAIMDIVVGFFNAIKLAAGFLGKVAGLFYKLGAGIIGAVITPILRIVGLFGRLITAFTNFVTSSGAVQKAAGAVGAVIDALLLVFQALGAIINFAIDELLNGGSQIREFILGALYPLKNVAIMVRDALVAFGTAVAALGYLIGLYLIDKIKIAAGWLGEKFAKGLAGLQERFKTFGGAIKNSKIYQFFEKTGQVIRAFFKLLGDKTPEGQKRLLAFKRALIKNFIPPAVLEGLTKLRNGFNSFTSGIRVLAPVAVQKLKEFGSGVKKYITNTDAFKTAKATASVFFDLWKRDPKLALQYAKSFGTYLAQRFVPEPVQRLWKNAKERLGGLMQTFTNSSLFKRAKSVAETFFTLWKRDPLIAVRYLKNLATSAFGAFGDFAKGIWEAVKNSEVFKKVLEFIKSIISDIQNGSFSFESFGKRFTEVIDSIKQSLSSFSLAGIIDKIKSGIDILDKRGLFSSLREAFSRGILGIFLPASASAESATPEEMSEAGVSTIKKTVDLIKDKALVYFETLKTYMTEKFAGADMNKVLQTAISGLVGLKIAGLIGSFSKFNKRFGKMFDNVGKGVQTLLEGTGGGVKGAMERFGEGIKGLFDQSSTSVKSLSEALTDLLKDPKKLAEKATNTAKELIYAKNKKHDSIGTTLLKIAGSVAILTAALYALSKIPIEDLKKAAYALGGVMAALLIFTGVLKAMKLGDTGKALQQIGIGLFALSAALFIMVQVAKQIAKLEGRTLIRGFGGLAVLLLMMRSFVKSVSGRQVKGMGQLIILSLALRVIVHNISVLGKMNGKRLLQGGITLVALLEVLKKFLKDTNGINVAAFGSLIGLAIAVTTFCWSISSLGNMDMAKLLKGVVGLWAVTKILAKFLQSANGMDLKAGVKMTLIGVAINAFIAPIKKLAELDTWSLVKGLGGLAVASKMLSMLSRSLSNVKVTSFIVLAVLAGSLWIIFQALDKLLSYNLETDRMLAVASFFGAFGIVLVGLAQIGKVGLGGVAAAILTIFGLFSVFEAIGAFSEFLKDTVGVDLLKTVKKGGEIVAEVGYWLGNMVGSLLRGLKEGAVGKNFLGDTGQALSEFMQNLQPFLNLVSGTDKTKLEGMKNLSAGMLSMTKAGFMEAVSQAFTGRNSFKMMAEGLKDLVPAMELMGNTKINYKNVDKATKALSSISKAAKEIPNAGGLLSAVFGDNAIDDFGTRLAAFGKGLKEYAGSLGKIDNLESVEASAKILEALAGAAAKIPDVGGLISLLYGDNTVDDFGTRLPAFGSGLQLYAMSVGGITDDMKQGSDRAVTIAQDIAKVAESMKDLKLSPLTGLGFNAMTFGAGLNLYANAISQIDSSVGGETGKSKIAVGIAEDLKALAQTMSGFGSGTIGKLGTLASNASDFGSKILLYAQSVEQLPEVGGEGGKSKMAVQLAEDVRSLASLVTERLGDVGNFGEKAAEFGAAIGLYADSIDDIGAEDMLSSVAAYALASGAIKLSQKISELNGVTGLTESIGLLRKVGTALKMYNTSLGTTVGDGAASKERAGKAWELVQALVDAMPEGLKEKVDEIKETKFEGFSGGLTELGGAIVAFASEAQGIGDAQKALDALTVLGNIANKIPDQNTIKRISEFGESGEELGGSTETTTVSKNYAHFSGGLKLLGQAVADFAGSVSELPDITNAIGALDQLKEIAIHIPDGTTINTIGQRTDQLKNYTNFSAGIISMGGAMKSFSESVGDFNGLKVAPAIAALGAMTLIAKMIPDENDFAQLVSFDKEWNPDLNGNKYQNFGAGIIALGGAMKSFGENVDGIKPDAVESATNALKVFAVMAKEDMPKTGGLVEFIMGHTDWSGFANGVGQLGTGIKAFNDNLGEEYSLFKSIKGIIALKGFIEEWDKIPFETLQVGTDGATFNVAESFGNSLATLGNDINSASTSLSGVSWSAFTDLTTNFESLKTSLGKIQELSTYLDAFQVIGGFDAQSKLNNMSDFLKAFDNYDLEAKTSFSEWFGLLDSSFESISANMTKLSNSLSSLPIEALISSVQSISKLKQALFGGFDTKSDTKNQLNNLRDFLKTLGHYNIGELGEFNLLSSIMQAIQNGTQSEEFLAQAEAIKSAILAAVTPTEGYTPTIRPVLDSTNLNGAFGPTLPLNGQLNVGGISGQASSVVDAVNLMNAGIGAKLTLTNSYLSDVVSNTSELRSSYSGDFENLTSQAGAIAENISGLGNVGIYLDGSILVGYVNRNLGGNPVGGIRGGTRA